MAGVFIHSKIQAISMKENGKLAKKMDLVFTPTPMGLSLKAPTKTMKDMASVEFMTKITSKSQNLNGKMVR